MRTSLAVTLAVAAATATAAAAAEPPRVASVRGETVSLAAGAAAGIAVDMTGRLCGTEEVGGQRVEVCPARFTIVMVSADDARAKITAGDAAAVSAGMAAHFDQPLTAAALTAEATLAAADRLFDADDFGRAAAAYRDFLTRFPDHPSTAYASGLATASEAKVAEAQAAAAARPPPPPGPTAAERAERLADQAARLLAAGLAADAATAAREALALVPGHAAATTTLRSAEQRLASTTAPAPAAAAPAPAGTRGRRAPAAAAPPVAAGTPPPARSPAPAQAVPAGPRGKWTVESCELTTRLKGGGAVSSLRLAPGALDMIEERYLAAGSDVAEVRRLRIMFAATGSASPGPHSGRGAEMRFIASFAKDLRFTPAWMDTAPRDLECTLVRTPP